MTDSSSSTPTPPDLSKRFHVRSGTEVIGTFDTRDEVDEALKEFDQHKAAVIAEASKLTSLGHLKIVDRGVPHPAKG